MGLELTWIALAASLMMGLAGACLFVWAVKKDYFHDIEDAKFQVFWSDVEKIVDPPCVAANAPPQENHERRA